MNTSPHRLPSPSALFAPDRTLPDAADPTAADTALATWADAAPKSLLESEPDEHVTRVLRAVFGNSPHLTRCVLAEPEFVQRLYGVDPDVLVDEIITECGQNAGENTSPNATMRAVRIAKRRVALLVALADITGVWPLEKIVGAISRIAETGLDLTAACLLGEAAANGVFELPGGKSAATDSGYVVLGMGKLGGRELNYSSDIDIIVLFDPDRMVGGDRERLGKRMVRLTRDLARMMEERTADGYVFRTDLRLRPDPGATPLAVSVPAAEQYYESMGQNWERAAMIKARPVAGDREAGQAFVDFLRPFVWRKSLDFAAIQDIHSIKRQIAAHKGGDAIRVAGHNVKLGQGGIREIEFFAQTQQLIWGGRDPSLRTIGTCDSLRALVAAGHVQDAVAGDLIESYGYLRRVEHRIQMTDDQQEHSVPADDEGLAALATFMGYGNPDDFAAELTHHLERVARHYAELFGESEQLSGPGNLVFTGTDHDPATIETLAGMGFAEPERASTLVRQWHHGRYRATRTVRAREILTELMPALLGALADTADPDQALLRFNGFLEALPSGVQLFSLFQMNPDLLGLVAEIMGSAPKLAEALSRRPVLLDGVLTADFFQAPPEAGELDESLSENLAHARDYQDVLDFTRRWTGDRRFQVGIRILRQLSDADSSGRALADVADTVLRHLSTAVEDDFASRHGRVEDGAMAVVALGKLGSRDMTPESDLDLVFIFDAPKDSPGSDGKKALSPGHYYARLGQSLISAITAPTAEGSLYEVDMRLRPSGNAGPLVSSLGAFNAYQHEEAWIWEHMALTRARVVCGISDDGAELTARIEKTIAGILSRETDPDRVLASAAAMRERMAGHRGRDNPWDVKNRRGGMVDIEFCAQYLILTQGAAHPDVRETYPGAALAAMATAGVLAPDAAADLIEPYDLWRGLQAVLRLTLAAPPESEDAIPEGLRRVLVRAGEVEDFAALKDKMETAAGRAASRFDELIATPAAALPEGLADIYADTR